MSFKIFLCFLDFFQAPELKEFHIPTNPPFQPPPGLISLYATYAIYNFQWVILAWANEEEPDTPNRKCNLMKLATDKNFDTKKEKKNDGEKTKNFFNHA